MAEKEAKAKKPSRFDVRNIGPRIAKFFREYRSEFKKIVWPTFNQVWKNTLITIVVIIIMAAFIAGLDTLFQFLYGLVLKGV